MGSIVVPPPERFDHGSRMLLPPVQQALWGMPAVINFALGGLGAGLYAVAAVTAGFARSPALQTAAWLGPLLVLGGFGAVAAEAGRPFRAPRVLARVRTSWMSRELWLGGAFSLVAVGGLVIERPSLRIVATAAAIAFVLAQGHILRHARGVTVWSVPPVPALFLTSALVSGAGLLVALEAQGGRPLDRLLGTALAALIVHVAVWSVLLTWSRGAAFRLSIGPLREGSSAFAIVVGGYALAALLAALAIALPPVEPLLAATAGVLMVAGQVAVKSALILQAGQLRPVSLALPPLQRRVS